MISWNLIQSICRLFTNNSSSLVWFSVRSGFCLSFAMVFGFSFSFLPSVNVYYSHTKQIKHRQRDKQTQIPAIVEWYHCCHFKKRTYVRKKRGLSGIFSVSNPCFSKHLPVYSFRFFYLLLQVCLSSLLLLLLLCLHFTFHPFKWFSAADDYQLTYTPIVCSIKCKAASNSTNNRLLLLARIFWNKFEGKNRFYMAKKTDREVRAQFTAEILRMPTQKYDAK